MYIYNAYNTCGIYYYITYILCNVEARVKLRGIAICDLLLKCLDCLRVAHDALAQCVLQPVVLRRQNVLY